MSTLARMAAKSGLRQWLVSMNLKGLPPALAGATYACGAKRRRDINGVYYAVVANDTTHLQDYDPVTKKWAYLAEPAQTNLCLYSSENNAAWGSTNGTKSSAGVSVIDGKTPILVKATTTGGRIQQTVGTLSGSTECFYAILEIDPLSAPDANASVRVRDATTATYVATTNANLTAGTYVAAVGTGGIVLLSNSGPNGGKVYLVWTAGTGTSGNIRGLWIYPDNVAGTGSIYVHHAQHVNGVTFTSPIVTSGSSVARAAEVLTYPKPAWVGNEFTLWASYSYQSPRDTYSTIINISDGTTANRCGMYLQSPNQLRALVQDATVTQVNTAIIGIGSPAKAACSHKLNDFKLTANGAAPQIDSLGTIPAMNLVTVGSRGTLEHGNLRLESFAVIPHALTSAQIQAVTL